jgi:putative transcriptional regulator
MEEQLFNELVDSVKQAKKIMKNELDASRAYTFQEPDVKAIRKKIGLSQAMFATLIGVSCKTLQNWEQGLRSPRGPARALLEIARKEPEAILRALHPKLA